MHNGENKMNELKDIRDRLIEEDGSIRISNFSRVFGGITAKIQQETYTLAYNKGRDEAKEEYYKKGLYDGFDDTEDAFNYGHLTEEELEKYWQEFKLKEKK